MRALRLADLYPVEIHDDWHVSKGGDGDADLAFGQKIFLIFQPAGFSAIDIKDERVALTGNAVFIFGQPGFDFCRAAIRNRYVGHFVVRLNLAKLDVVEAVVCDVEFVPTLIAHAADEADVVIVGAAVVYLYIQADIGISERLVGGIDPCARPLQVKDEQAADRADGH